MQKLAIIGAGISGLTVARLLKGKYDVTVFEKESTPGGLVRCKRLEDSLFHTCGGHVFNTKNEEVMQFFQSVFNLDEDFSKIDRNSSILFENGEVATLEQHGLFKKKMSDIDTVPYPVENHIYMLKPEIQKSVINDIFKIKVRQKRGAEPKSFATFLKRRFGDTLYNIYFKPYNQKIWQTDLRKIPLSWLEGKLPMPTPDEILLANFNHVQEKKFVHSSFYYENNGGSQFLADKLSDGSNVTYNQEVTTIEKTQSGWKVNGFDFDKVVFCGNIKDLPKLIQNVPDFEEYTKDIDNLDYHGTTTVFCEMDRNPYSWIYLPGEQHKAHRIICTGNFASSNNASEMKLTGTVEFTDYISEDDIKYELAKMPLHPRYIAHVFNKYTYPIQNEDTRAKIAIVKQYLSKLNLYLTGRFADWEYYNMDVAMSAAINTCKNL